MSKTKRSKKTSHVNSMSSVTCPYGWEYFGGKCYKRFTSESNIAWPDAQTNCTYYGGRLAILHDDELNNFITNITGAATTWIGALRIGPYNQLDQFIWNDGSPMDYANFYFTQPDNLYGYEFCVMTNFGDPGNWNDQNCFNEYCCGAPLVILDYVCQLDSYYVKKAKDGCYCDPLWNNTYLKSTKTELLWEGEAKSISECIYNAKHITVGARYFNYVEDAEYCQVLSGYERKYENSRIVSAYVGDCYCNIK